MLRRRHGMKPLGSAGVPPAQVLAQPRPSPPPGSTGNGARTLLRLSPCRSRRQVAGCRIAGKLSGTQRDSMRAGRPRSRVAPPPITLAPQGGARRLAGPQPCRCGRAVTLGGPSSFFGRVEDWRVDYRVRWRFRRFRFGPQSGSPITFPVPALRTRRAVFPHLGSPVGSCVSHTGPRSHSWTTPAGLAPSPTPSTSAPGLPPGLLMP